MKLKGKTAFLKENAVTGRILGKMKGPQGEPMLKFKNSNSGAVEAVHVEDLVVLGEVLFTER